MFLQTSKRRRNAKLIADFFICIHIPLFFICLYSPYAIELAQEMIGEPVEVIDSFFQEAPADAKPLWFLGKSLELLSGADVAYFAQGWEDARGCAIEHDSALAYGIKSIVA